VLVQYGETQRFKFSHRLYRYVLVRTSSVVSEVSSVSTVPAMSLVRPCRRLFVPVFQRHKQLSSLSERRCEWHWQTVCCWLLVVQLSRILFLPDAQTAASVGFDFVCVERAQGCSGIFQFDPRCWARPLARKASCGSHHVDLSWSLFLDARRTVKI
jgi:hypothetical protein